jgi:glycine/D-amino acid oxidase-like deaminating enzyme
MHKDFPGAWFALGYGGNGITFAVIAAEIIADGLCGRPSPDGFPYRFDRPAL